ncbi:MAG: cyclic-di-AMP receptor [Chloroflexi bacterium]|nr:cyclic-di-AMP receptor [Chloroflexota bacterium]
MPNYSLILAVIQLQDEDSAISALTNAGLGVTRMGSTGGFLETGNVTLLMQLEDTQVEQAIALLKKTCVERTTLINATAVLTTPTAPYFFSPTEVVVGGAIMFVLPIRRVVRMSNPRQDQVAHHDAINETSLMLVIVHDALVPNIISDLTNANYRVTRISTTGGFMRQGNTTLLIGVVSSQADDVLNRIESACRTKDAKNATPKSQATIFELAVERLVRI